MKENLAWDVKQSSMEQKAANICWGVMFSYVKIMSQIVAAIFARVALFQKENTT